MQRRIASDSTKATYNPTNLAVDKIIINTMYSGHTTE